MLISCILVMIRICDTRDQHEKRSTNIGLVYESASRAICDVYVEVTFLLSTYFLKSLLCLLLDWKRDVNKE